MEHTPVSLDYFIYELEDGREWTDPNGEVVRRSARFDAEDAVTTVDVYLCDGWWCWEAMHHTHRHDAYFDCAKDTWGEAAHDAYYELLKHHWL